MDPQQQKPLKASESLLFCKLESLLKSKPSQNCARTNAHLFAAFLGMGAIRSAVEFAKKNFHKIK
jgi:hypothetical protein